MKEIKTKTEHYYKDNNGRKQGSYKSYYSNGQLMVDAVYKDNKHDGPYKSYHYNGQLEVETFYKDGKRNGPYKKYHDNGQLESDLIFKDGEDITDLVNKLNTWNKLSKQL